MNVLACVLGLVLALAWPFGASAGANAPQDPAAPTGFRVVDLVLDAGRSSLGAWQCEVKVVGTGARIVSIEGGEPAAFRSAPYYDPAALQQGRLLVAAFSTDAELPSGSVRVARLHLHCDEEADYRLAVTVQAAAGPDGEAIEVGAELR